MKHPSLRHILQALAFAALSALVLSGCASSSTATVSRMRPIAPDVRSALGPVVGLVTPAEPAAVGFEPSAGRAGTAGDGAIQGLKFMAQGGAGSGEGAIVALALMPVAAAVGAMIESSRQLPAEEVRRSEAELAAGLHLAAQQHALRDAFLEAARTGDQRDYLSAKDVAGAYPWRIEMSVTDLQLRRTDGSADSYTLTIQSRVRLVRATDGEVVYDETVAFRSGSALFYQWADNRGQPLRRVAETGYRMIAAEVLAGLDARSS